MTDDTSTRDPGSDHIVHLPDDPARTVVWEGDYTHRSVFTDVSLSNLLRADGFSIEVVHPRYLPYSMRGRLLKPAWIVQAYLSSLVRAGLGSC
jgi:hypothetical protein